MQTARFRTLAVAGAALALMLSTTSFATAQSTVVAQSGSTFLLQLGEHQSQDAARRQWDSLQNRYPDQLSSLSLRVSPVRVGSKEAFRTQAAGVTSYAQAQSVCTELSGAGITCSVVETSMYQPEESVAPVNVASRPATPRFFEPQPQEPAALQPVDEIAAQPVPAAAAPVEVAAAPQANPSPADNRSFGQKYLPWLGFGKGDETAAATETTTAAAPAESVSSESSETVTLTRDDAAPATIVESRAAAADLPVAAPTNTVRTTRTPVQQFGSRPTQQELAARAPRNLAAPQAAPVAQAEPVAAPLAQPAPVSTASNEYVDIPVQPQAAPEVVNVNADAEVAEAVQVPVSTFDTAPAVLANRPVGYGGFPSQPAVTKAGESWVQLGYFASKEAAFAFSRDISRQNPDLLQFVRIRIVNPYESGRAPSARSGDHTSMRLGPFREQSQVNRVCAIAKENKLSCSLVSEVGTSGARSLASAGRSRYNPAENASRREAVNRGYNRTAGALPAGAYWVQLGAFDSTSAAQQRWVELQGSNKDKLARLAPQISYPALSSSTAPVYHLRTGPFVNKVGALDLCDSLRTRSVNCVVVQAR